jgi:hypothetical protein
VGDFDALHSTASYLEGSDSNVNSGPAILENKMHIFQSYGPNPEIILTNISFQFISNLSVSYPTITEYAYSFAVDKISVNQPGDMKMG